MAQSLAELQAQEAALLQAITDRPSLGVMKAYTNADGSTTTYRFLSEIRGDLAVLRSRIALLEGVAAGVAPRRTYATPGRGL